MTAPLTPFEETGEPATLAQEQAFLDQIQADTDRVQQILLGHTDDGSPFHAVILGDPPPTSPAGLQCALIVASQHGQEWSAREAALQTIRNYAYTKDQEALEELPAVVVYNANPWGAENMRRVNSLEQDINRFHISLEAVEARYINELINSVNPAFVYDGHEFSDSYGGDGVINFGPPRLVKSPEYSNWLNSFFSELETEFSDVETDIYPMTEHEGTLTNALTARGYPSNLYEVLITEPDIDRASLHVRAMKHAIRYAHDNKTLLQAVREQSREFYKLEGFAAHASAQVSPGEFAKPALGYLIEPDVELLRTLNTLRIKHFPATDGVYIPLDQGLAPAISWLLDPRAPRPIRGARPIFWGDDPPIDFLAKPDPMRLPTRLNFGGQEPRRLITKEGVVWGT